MQKFRRFDDPSCGINPFVPNNLKKNKSVLPLLLLKKLINIVLLPIKLIFFSLFVSIFIFLKILNRLTIIKKFKHLNDRILSQFFCTLLLSLFGVYSTSKKYYHYTHPKHSYRSLIKNQSSNIHQIIQPGQLILSTQQSIIEYLVLQKFYSPTYATVDIDTGKIQVLKGLRLLLFAIGSKTTQSKSKLGQKLKIKLQSLTQVMNNKQHPIVLFIEGCKTNGLGILKIHDQIQTQTLNYAIKGGKIHTFRLDSQGIIPNTTDDCGIFSLVNQLSKFSTSITIWFYTDLQKKALEDQYMIENVDYQKWGKLVQASMASNYSRYSLSIDASSYPQFLKYWKARKNKRYDNL